METQKQGDGSSSYNATPLTTSSNVSEPGEKDVVFGNNVGNRYNTQHSGTCWWNKMIIANLQHYLVAKCKRDYAMKIVQAVHDRGGRFLARDEKTETWYEVDNKKAVTKTATKFRRLKGPQKGSTAKVHIEARMVASSQGKYPINTVSRKAPPSGAPAPSQQDVRPGSTFVVTTCTAGLVAVDNDKIYSESSESTSIGENSRESRPDNLNQLLTGLKDYNDQLIKNLENLVRQQHSEANSNSAQGSECIGMVGHRPKEATNSAQHQLAEHRTRLADASEKLNQMQREGEQKDLQISELEGLVKTARLDYQHLSETKVQLETELAMKNTTIRKMEKSQYKLQRKLVQKVQKVCELEASVQKFQHQTKCGAAWRTQLDTLVDCVSSAALEEDGSCVEDFEAPHRSTKMPSAPLVQPRSYVLDFAHSSNPTSATSPSTFLAWLQQTDSEPLEE